MFILDITINNKASVARTIYDAFSPIVRGPYGIIQGGNDAIKLYRTGTALPSVNLDFSSTGKEGVNKSIGKWVENLCKRFIGWMGEGATILKDTGFFSKVKGVIADKSFNGLSGVLGAAEKNAAGKFIVGGIGGRGALMAGGYAGIAALAVGIGISAAYKAFHKADEINRGYPSDIERNPYVHGAQAACAAVAAVGGAAMFFNPVGLAAVGVGTAGFLALGVVKWFRNGFHWYNRPNLAPMGIRQVLKSFRNPGLMEPPV